MVAGREWRPGAPTFLATGLMVGFSALLRRLYEERSDLDTEWRRVVTLLVGLMVPTQGMAALVTIEDVWSLSARVVEA
eukprot:15435606-Alexandrium_andersonii.AAC.1